MKKRILAMLLCLALVGTMLPMGVVAQDSSDIVVLEETQAMEALTEIQAPADETQEPTEEETVPEVVCSHIEQGWTEHDGESPLPTSGTIILTESVELSQELLVDGTELSICLNGKNITAAVGARIFRVINGGKLTICDCKGTGEMIGSNVAVNGGAVQVEKNSQFDFRGGKITGVVSSKDGAGVYVAGSGATFNMFGGSISGNTTTGGGGGVCAGTDSTVNITGGSITGNTAANGGGIIIQGTNAVVLLKDCSITDNTGTSNAGGVYVGYNTASTTQVLTFSGNVQVTGNVGGTGKIAANVQLMSDARVFHVNNLGANAKIGVRKNSGTEIIPSGASTGIVENFVSDSPAKVFQYLDGKLNLIDKPEGAVNHADTAGYTACSHDTQSWAGWFSADSMPTESGCYYLSGNVNLIDAWKIGEGQTITICLNGFNITQTGSKQVIAMTGGKLNICDCTAKTENGTYTAGKITGANTSERGAGVNLQTGAEFNLYDGAISGNTSTSYGGGVYVIGATFNMYGGSVDNNHADSQSGGGICTNGNAIVNVTGGTISGNSAKNGGAIIAQGAGNEILLKDCSITGNTATNLGGGIYVGKPDCVTLSGKLNITGNTKGSVPSNVFVCSTATEERAVIQKDLHKDSTIGIGIYLTTKSSVLVKSGVTEETVGCYISDDNTKITKLDGDKLVLAEKPAPTPNHADTEGYTACGHGEVTWIDWSSTDSLPTDSGTYYLMDDVYLSGTWKVENGQTITICLNGFDIIQTAAKRVIHVTNGTVNICDCTAKTENGVYTAGKITGANTSDRGAGVGLETGAEFNLYDGAISGNTSTSYGGGVYVIGATFNMYGGSVDNNHADSQSGGGICTNGNAIVNVTGGFITNNSAKNGGAIIAQGTDNEILLKDCSITGNTATNLGGGIYVGKPDCVTLSGKLNITGNTKGTEPSNVFVCSTASEERAVMQDNLHKDSTIGIGIYLTTKSNVLVKSGATEATLSCYTPDDSTKMIKYENGKLLLVEKPLFTPNHANTEGYTACGHGEVTWTDWYKTDSLPTESGYYYLVEDVNLTKVWNAGEDKEITICLNGHSITQTTEGLRVIRVGASTLNICDCTAHVDENGEYISGKITGGNTDASDAAGNAGAMMLTNGGIFRLYDGNITDNHTEGNGVIVAQKDFTFEMHGGRIMNNTAGKQGGAVYMSRAVMTMTGGEILGNEAVGSGGAIYNYGGEFTMSGGIIGKNNTTTGGGGGIALKNASADAKAIVTISGGEIRENTAKLDGSGIRMDSGEFTISGGKILKNGTEEGSAGGLRLGDGKVTISGGQISQNIGGNAAGILAMCDVTMTGGEISGNVGSGNGPGIYMSGATFYLSGGSIRNNDATGNGGGVYLAQAKMEMTGGEISGNRGGMGGGIYNYGGTVTVKGGVIKNNDAYKLGGGGIYSNNRFADDKVTVTAEASLIIAGGEISGNKSKTDGAGLRADSGNFRMSDGVVSGNSAEGSCGGMSLKNVYGAEISGGLITKNKAANAAGVYINQGSLTVSGGEISHNAGTGSGAGILASSADVKFSGGVIEENSAKGDGAGLYISNGKLSLCGGKVNKNRAEKVCGGVLATKNAKVYFTSGTISGNTAKASSGGMMIQTGSMLQMSGGTISNNITVNHGGGIYINKNSSAYISGGSIVSNAARKSGGGIYVGKDAKLTFSGGNVSSNDATTQGGGILVAGATTISGGKISKNTSKREGAGVYITNVTMTFKGGSIEENVTTYNGGGICVRGETGVLEMSEDAKVLNNKCKESGGGILVQGQGKLVMHGGEIIGNYAPNGGGGIRLHNCPGEIYGGKINENISNGQGAGIYSNLSLIIKDAEVCNNKVEANPDIKQTRTSAAIRTYNESTLVMENVKVIGNTCDGRAGAMEIAYHVKADVKNCVFQENTATERGGSFVVYREGELYMNGCTVSGGSTKGNGGAFDLDPYGEIFLTDCTISNNAADMGGVAYIGTKGRAELIGCTVENNVADSHASVIWANGSVVLDDTVITGNKDKKGGAAIYLDNAGQDTESYMPGVHEIRGNTTVYGNDGGDLVLINDAFINIHGDGLGADSKIQVKLQDSDITRWIVGPYNYEVSGDGFLLTQGEDSYNELFMGSGESAPVDTEEEEQTQEQEDSNLPLIIGGGAAAVVLALVVILVAILAKKKKNNKK